MKENRHCRPLKSQIICPRNTVKTKAAILWIKKDFVLYNMAQQLARLYNIFLSELE